MILSIQSHVAYGRVGNRSAVFPLELIGQDVIAIHTVQFSNHTGYGDWHGQVFGAEHIRDILNGVDDRGGLDCQAVLSGYMGDAETGEVILEAVDRVRKVNSGAIYCLDPVMGDYGRGFFVRPGIPEFIKAEAIGRATIVTPNQFEAEYLADMPIKSEADALAACQRIRAFGPEIVLITSFMPNQPEGKISMYLSAPAGEWALTTDQLPLSPEPNGAGDLTAALFLGRYLENRDAKTALELMANSVFAVFDKTYRAGTREIQLVAARFEIMNPPMTYSARKL
jgi:pyridoxine kinase